MASEYCAQKDATESEREVYKTGIIPAMLCEVNILATTKNQEQWIEVNEMRIKINK